MATYLNVGDNVEIVVNMLVQGQQTLNVWQYNVGGWPGTVTMVQMLEGYWNNVKAAYRAVIPSAYGNVFVSIKGRELNNPAGLYAEYDVPTAERPGTRGTSGDQMPPFASAGVRLVVGTRATRPGQKRFPGLMESDQSAGVLGATVLTPLVTLMNLMVANMTLGAPAALVMLEPIVTRKDALGNVTAEQPVTGYLINPNVTTQNTRKFGRGA